MPELATEMKALPAPDPGTLLEMNAIMPMYVELEERGLGLIMFRALLYHLPPEEIDAEFNEWLRARVNA